MDLYTDFTSIIAVVIAMSFVVNIIVQMTKGFIHLPTKLWCIVVSIIILLLSLCIMVSIDMVEFHRSYVCVLILTSFIVAYIAMYGFDTFKELWLRFKAGENINDDNK